ncbi:MAG: tRNA uracil 4-sulfurtransferase ThiI [Solirubrobacterales bacterium]
MTKSADTPVQKVFESAHDAPVCLLAKVGEASLKGRNKRHFLDALRRNTRAALRGLDARVEGGGSVFVVPVPDELTAAEVASRLERVFGFVTGSVCLRCERDPERIAEVGMVAFARAQPRTFSVRVRRRDKSFPLTSQEMERQVGAAIQERTALPVDLSCPDLELRVEVDAHAAYVHVRELAGAGGLPVGTSGRAVALLSGGIDSPVASLLAMKRGLEVEYLHFSGEPYLDPAATVKAQAQARVLNGFQAARPGPMWVVPFGHQQRMLSAVSPESHRIVLYRRQMARIGCALAARLRAAALVTGDSLGQVSSQTLTNMTLVEDASELPVLRPLLAWDKREVMAKAASLGILSLSELPADDACPLFAGGKQRTAVPRADVLEAEAQLDLDALAESAAAEARRIEPGVLLDPLQRESRAA